MRLEKIFSKRASMYCYILRQSVCIMTLNDTIPHIYLKLQVADATGAAEQMNRQKPMDRSMKRVQKSTTSTSLLCTVITVFVLHRCFHHTITVTRKAESTWFPRQYLESSLKTRIYDLFFLACSSLARAAVLQIAFEGPLLPNSYC